MDGPRVLAKLMHSVTRNQCCVVQENTLSDLLGSDRTDIESCNKAITKLFAHIDIRLQDMKASDRIGFVSSRLCHFPHN